jgi:hypothetical protein
VPFYPPASHFAAGLHMSFFDNFHRFDCPTASLKSRIRSLKLTQKPGKTFV